MPLDWSQLAAQEFQRSSTGSKLLSRDRKVMKGNVHGRLLMCWTGNSEPVICKVSWFVSVTLAPLMTGSEHWHCHLPNHWIPRAPMKGFWWHLHVGSSIIFHGAISYLSYLRALACGTVGLMAAPSSLLKMCPTEHWNRLLSNHSLRLVY